MRLIILVLAFAVIGGTPASAAGAHALRAAGHDALAAGKTAQAITFYRRALVADPKQAASYLGLGRAHAAAGEADLAAKYFADALMLDPTDRAALLADGLLAASPARKDQSRAQVMLDRLRVICGTCAEANHLASALNVH